MEIIILLFHVCIVISLSLGSVLAANLKQKGLGTVFLSIFAFIAIHSAITTFNTLIACHRFSQYLAAPIRPSNLRGET